MEGTSEDAHMPTYGTRYRLFAVVLLLIIGKIEMTNGNQHTLNSEKTAKAIEFFFAQAEQTVTPQQIAEQMSSPSSMQHPDLGPLLNFRGNLGTLWVSSRNYVVYYSGKAITGKNRPITANEGYDMANHFAKRQVPEFAQRNYEADPQEADVESLTLRWTEVPRPDAETSIFPNWVEVVVDLTQGRVKRFSASDLHLVRTTPPKFNKEQAEARIKAEFEKAAIEEIELMEQPFWDEPKVITVWSALVLTLEPEGPVTVRVTINADTGEIIPE